MLQTINSKPSNKNPTEKKLKGYKKQQQRTATKEETIKGATKQQKATKSRQKQQQKIKSDKKSYKKQLKITTKNARKKTN